MGARLESWDDTPCRDIPGYLAVVRQGDFLAVVASDEWAAVRASRALVAKWSAGQGLPDDARLVAYMRGAKVDRSEPLQRTAGPAAPLAGAGRQLRASYDFPLNGSIGPSCAVADFKEGALTVWTPSLSAPSRPTIRAWAPRVIDDSLVWEPADRARPA